MHFLDDVSATGFDEERPLMSIRRMSTKALGWIKELMAVADENCDCLDALATFGISCFLRLPFFVGGRILCP